MKCMKLCISIPVLLVLIAAGSQAIAAGSSWTPLLKLPQQDSGVQMEQPVSISVDSLAKRYYVVDAAKGQLVSFDGEGKFLAAFTAGGQLKHPVAMAKSSSGSLWVIERSSNELFFINPKQKKVQRFSPTYADGSAVFPARLQLGSNGELYLLDRMQGNVLKLDDNLKVVQVFSGEVGSQGFVDFAIHENKLFALDGLGRNINQFQLQGKLEKVIQLAGLEFPTALEVDPAGKFYLLDRHAGTVVVFSRSGEREFDFLGKGNRSGQLWNGTDLLFDWQGRLCVVDEGNGRVDVLTR